MGDAQITSGIKEAGAKKPDGIATCYGRRRRSWAEVLARVARVAGGFRALRVGAVAVPINTRLAPAEVRAILEDSESETLVIDEMSAPLIGAALGE